MDVVAHPRRFAAFASGVAVTLIVTAAFAAWRAEAADGVEPQPRPG